MFTWKSNEVEGNYMSLKTIKHFEWYYHVCLIGHCLFQGHELTIWGTYVHLLLWDAKSALEMNESLGT